MPNSAVKRLYQKCSTRVHVWMFESELALLQFGKSTYSDLQTHLKMLTKFHSYCLPIFFSWICKYRVLVLIIEFASSIWLPSWFVLKLIWRYCQCYELVIVNEWGRACDGSHDGWGCFPSIFLHVMILLYHIDRSSFAITSLGVWTNPRPSISLMAIPSHFITIYLKHQVAGNLRSDFIYNISNDLPSFFTHKSRLLLSEELINENNSNFTRSSYADFGRSDRASLLAAPHSSLYI